MNGLILFGSPHINGKTNKILDKIIDLENEHINFKRINLLNKNIRHCIGCNECNKEDYKCIYNDDMVDIYKAIEASDLVILATPIYFNSVTSIMKVMIDRCQRFYNMKVNHQYEFKSKIGVLLATAGSKNPKSFDSFINIAEYFFLSINGNVEETLFIDKTDEETYLQRNLSEIEKMKKFLYTIHKDQ